ncbi:MAG: hypothetical protein RI884_2949 [Pseudomonadota bacterium]
MSSPVLFTPLRLGPLEIPNRIMVSPMCQYSGIDGLPTAWHRAHLGALAISGAGLLCLEATAVSPEGRITPGCLGLWSDAHEAALGALVHPLREFSPIKIGLQLSHAGRKSSSHRPWQGGALIPPSEGGWQPVAPSAIAHKPEEAPPQAMSAAQIRQLVDDFAAATRRARRLGFELVELHMAHGYLLHQFLSPLSNQRDDAYGGSAEARMRLPMEVLHAVREAAGSDMAVGVRLSATDWAEGGWDIDGTVEISRRMAAAGCDFLDISSGGLSWQQKIAIGPGYQVPFAQQVRQAVSIPVATVGLITTPRQAEDILVQGQADLVALARAFLLDPRWPWRAAAELGGTVQGPQQMYRCLPAGHPPIFGDVRTAQR